MDFTEQLNAKLASLGALATDSSPTLIAVYPLDYRGTIARVADDQFSMIVNTKASFSALSALNSEQVDYDEIWTHFVEINQEILKSIFSDCRQKFRILDQDSNDCAPLITFADEEVEYWILKDGEEKYRLVEVSEISDLSLSLII